MKIRLNPIIEGISGKLKDLVFVTPDKELVGDNLTRSTKTYVRSGYRKSPNTSISQDNLNAAFKIVVASYNELKTQAEAYETWRQAAQSFEASLNRVVTPYLLFTAYHMTQYTHTLGSDVHPESLSPGLSLFYEHRATRVWNPPIPGGYGTGTYGFGTFGA